MIVFEKNKFNFVLLLALNDRILVLALFKK